MGISTYYGAVESDEERFKVLDAAHAAGSTFWDTADVYGDSEELLGKWFKRTGKRADIFLASKFGFTPSYSIDGSPEYVKKAAESSLKTLGVDYIDLYYLHRADAKVPIEVRSPPSDQAGKIKHIGLSEISAATLRRAHAVHPIAAIQVEYSPFTLDIEDPKIGLLATARELGVQVVAYSPLGRGLLTGAICASALDSGGGMLTGGAEIHRRLRRRRFPQGHPSVCSLSFLDSILCDSFTLHVVHTQYSAENFPNILKLAAGLKAIGEKYGGATAGQVALAWVLAAGGGYHPDPGDEEG
ncbi:NADP-dependent oxidoreductase domain-containing protein [Mycena olivaceomarginata]|nr:NADP-dependent oxidoreductase domain-containing protein [Mycena olivaceomarginata]